MSSVAERVSDKTDFDQGGETEVKGYYDPEHSGTGLEVPAGRLSIEVRNIPEFRKLVEQAKQEADQLKKTIDQLQYFELNIDFSSDPTSSKS